MRIKEQETCLNLHEHDDDGGGGGGGGDDDDDDDEIKVLIRGASSSVRIATRYGLDGPGIESWCGRDFPHLSRPALGPTQPAIQWVSGLFWG